MTTPDEIIKLALETGLQSSEEHWGTVYRAASAGQLEAFYKAAYKAAYKAGQRDMREAAADTCEGTAEDYRGTTWGKASETVCDKCADAIRALPIGEKT